MRYAPESKGICSKMLCRDELIECIHAVDEGGTWIPPVVGATLAKRLTGRQLTVREAEVLCAMSKGKSNKEIGATLNISEATVKVHMTHILEKLRVAGRTEAIHVAVNRGLVKMDSLTAVGVKGCSRLQKNRRAFLSGVLFQTLVKPILSIGTQENI